MSGFSDCCTCNFEAMGRVMHVAAMSGALEEQKIDSNPYEGMMETFDKIDNELGWLSKEERVLLDELVGFFETHETKKPSETKNEVKRAREIIEELQIDVNFPALPYGQKFLSAAVYHSLDMVKMLIEKGADVNSEDEMDGSCAIDNILENEEDEDKLSGDMAAMKKLLISKGAKTREERWNDRADAWGSM